MDLLARGLGMGGADCERRKPLASMIAADEPVKRSLRFLALIAISQELAALTNRRLSPSAMLARASGDRRGLV